MNPLDGKRVLIFDHGLFVYFAQQLVRFGANVAYFTPWSSAFPHPADVAVGEGLEGIERVYDFFDEVDAADVIVFPDVGDGDLQDMLRKAGKRVWGSGGSQWLELDRMASRKRMAEVGIETPPTVRITGIDRLKAHLDSVEDRWVKISLFRGAFETYHHVKPFMTAEWLKVIGRDLGPLAKSQEFVVEEGVEGVEVGWDCHSIEGKFPKLGYYGIEVKDKAMVGTVTAFEDLPEKIRTTYDALTPDLAEGHYRNYFSLEMRLAKKGQAPIVIDPCCRFGSPCTEAWAELAANLPEIIWAGSGGELAEFEPAAKFAALAVVTSDWAVTNWTPVHVPKAIRPYVKMKCLTEIKGDWYYVPGDLKMSEIAVVVGTGDTLDEAVKSCKDRAGKIEGYKLDIKTDALDEGEQQAEAGEKVGIPFGKE